MLRLVISVERSDELQQSKEIFNVYKDNIGVRWNDDIRAAYFLPSVEADDWDKTTVVTLNVTVEAPGKVLTPGTYIFKVADVSARRDIVEILIADGKRVVVDAPAATTYRNTTSDDPVITFEERPLGSPEVLHTWFFPGNTRGLRFLYPARNADEH